MEGAAAGRAQEQGLGLGGGLEGEVRDRRVIHRTVALLCCCSAAEAGWRSLEAAARVQVADLRLELKCSTAVWLVSVPWLMSCGTGSYLASRWHPHSSQLFQSIFPTKMPPAPLSCCYKQLPDQPVDCGAPCASITFHQTNSTVTGWFIPDTRARGLCYFLLARCFLKPKE